MRETFIAIPQAHYRRLSASLRELFQNTTNRKD
jgi:hypothetical protein